MLISFVGFFDAQINVDCDDEDEETSAGSDEGSAKGGSFSGSGKLKRPASEEQSEEELLQLLLASGVWQHNDQAEALFFRQSERTRNVGSLTSRRVSARARARTMTLMMKMQELVEKMTTERDVALRNRATSW